PPGLSDSNYQTLQPTTRVIDNVTSEIVYDYGAGSVGSLLRKRIATFLHVNPINAVDYSAGTLHIMNRPTDQQILDSSSSRLAETQYEYDSFTEGLTASGAIQHTAAYN